MATGEMEAAIGADMAATEAFGDALAGTDKPFVNTSGTLMLAMIGLDRTGTEEDRSPGGHRADVENATLALADRGVRSSVIRLSPLVHSHLDKHGFGPILIGLARENGFAGYPGEGANRWPAVDTRDAATLYRLAVEKAPAGQVLHGVGDEGVPLKEIAAAIGRGADLAGAARSPRTRSPATSASSPASSPSTTRPRTRSPARSSAGSRSTPA